MEHWKTSGLEFGNKLYGSIMVGISGSYYFQTRVSADQFELENGSLEPIFDTVSAIFFIHKLIHVKVF